MFSKELVVPRCSGTIALSPSLCRAGRSGPSGFHPVLEIVISVRTATRTSSTEALNIWM
jgi:hypothetical protein